MGDGRIMKAIILAAGGNKKKSLSDICHEKPVCLLEIEGSSLLEIQIDILHANGIEDIVVVKGYHGDKIDIPGIRYYTNPDFAETNALYSLFCARKELDEECLVIYSDILFEDQLLKRILAVRQDISIGVNVNWLESFRQRKSASAEDFELVYFDSDSLVERIGKLPDVKERKNRGLFNGILKLSHHGARVLQRHYDRFVGLSNGSVKDFNRRTAYISDLLREMAWLGTPIFCVINESGWLEIETREDYERALTDTGFVRRLVKVKTDWKKRSESYNKLDWVNRNDILNSIVEIADLKGNEKVLDVGTGTGKILMGLKEGYPLVTEFYGVDISEEMMARIDPRNGFRLCVGNIENLDQFEDSTFDLITARMVFHHCENPLQATAEVFRLLKKGGRFILCEGNPPDHQCLDFYKKMFFFKEDRHSFLESDMINLLVKAGFGDITTKTVIYENSSLNNWLSNSALPVRNIEIISELHKNCDDKVKEAYKMRIVDDDILMDWKFSIVFGEK